MDVKGVGASRQTFVTRISAVERRTLGGILRFCWVTEGAGFVNLRYGRSGDLRYSVARHSMPLRYTPIAKLDALAKDSRPPSCRPLLRPPPPLPLAAPEISGG